MAPAFALLLLQALCLSGLVDGQLAAVSNHWTAWQFMDWQTPEGLMYLSSLQIECPTGEVLSRVQFEQNGGEFRYAYDCINTRQTLAYETIANDWTVYRGGQGEAGTINFLERQVLSCPERSFLTAIRMEIRRNSGELRYRFTCGRLNSGPELMCQARSTKRKDPEGFSLPGLRHHDVKCDRFEGLTKLQLRAEFDPSLVRYDYTCCRQLNGFGNWQVPQAGPSGQTFDWLFGIADAVTGGAKGRVQFGSSNEMASCDFKTKTFGVAKVNNTRCVEECLSVPGCTHYVWKQSDVGTCFFKGGRISKKDAIPATDNRNISLCGVIPRNSPRDSGTNCSFIGQELDRVSVPLAECVDTCRDTPMCTHYVWSDARGGICSLRHNPNASMLEAVKTKKSLTCGLIRENFPAKALRRFTWDEETNTASGCDFLGGNLKAEQSTLKDCPDRCSKNPECTHYVWSSTGGGTCELKRNVNIQRRDAVVNRDAACGILDRSLA